MYSLVDTPPITVLAFNPAWPAISTKLAAIGPEMELSFRKPERTGLSKKEGRLAVNRHARASSPIRTRRKPRRSRPAPFGILVRLSRGPLRSGFGTAGLQRGS